MAAAPPPPPPGTGPSFVRGGDSPTEGQAFYFVNLGHEALLDTHGAGMKVKVWNNGGRRVTTVIAQNKSKHRENLRWKLVSCPHEKNVFYIVNVAHTAFLDTHGPNSAVSVWNGSGRTELDIIAGNTSAHAGNIRWKLVPCPHQTGTFYIVNVAHSAFMDTHGDQVNVWNSSGKTEAAIIAGNISKHAGNIRWCLIDVRKQDRFGAAMQMYGMAGERPPHFARHCGEGSADLDGSHKLLVQQCLAALGPGHDVASAVFRAYSTNKLYHQVNAALVTDDDAGLQQYGGFVRALRRAMVDRCTSGLNVQSGVVWRGMQVDDTSAYEPGQKFLWGSFVSTSKSEDSCFNANMLFKIHLDGEGLTYAVDISADSAYPHEEEVLIYPYSGYEVLSREDREDGTVIIELRTFDTLQIDPAMGTLPIGSMPDFS